MLYNHKKRGGTYDVLETRAKFQFSADRAVEQALQGVDLTVYQSTETGDVYVRPSFEFSDGRFTPVGKRSSLEETFEKTQTEGTVRGMRHVALQVRKFLAGALCAECGEPLGEGEEIVMDDDERTIHARCEEGKDD